MLWYMPWSENIKKRACRYLLQRYLGNFLEEKLTLDQLSVDLYNGTGTVCDVSLDCEALNELGDSQNWPLEIVDGQMQKITVTIPWSTIFKDDSVVEVDGLSITVQPKEQPEPASSVLESMWSSMSSSMQLAAECLQEEPIAQETNTVEGIEMFAQAIDSILSRVKVRFVNTKIRIEHVPKNGDRGVALEIRIQNIQYFDEAGSEPTPEVTDPDKPKTYIIATYSNKKIKFDGVSLYTDEFPSKLRTMARSLVMENTASSHAVKTNTNLSTSELSYHSTITDIFFETTNVPTTFESKPVKYDIAETEKRPTFRELNANENINHPEPILFAKIEGQQELSMKMKLSTDMEGPKVEIKVLLGALVVFITPRQLHTLIELCDALNQPQLEDRSNIPSRSAGMHVQCKPMKKADYQLIEAQLVNNMTQQGANMPGMYGWSGPGNEDMEDSASESEKFHPMTTRGNEMAESFSSSVSSMSTSVSSSVNVPSAQPCLKRTKKVPRVEGDPTAEVSHISVKIVSVAFVLLHKDVLVPLPLGRLCITPTSATALHNLSKEFFDRLPRNSGSDSPIELCEVNKCIDIAAVRNHLRLVTTEITLDGSEKLTSAGSQILCDVAVTELLVREYLYSPTVKDGPAHFDIINFEFKASEGDDNSSKGESSNSQPNIQIQFKQMSKYMRISGEKKLMYPTTDIVVNCSPCDVFVDLTLVERMSATWLRARRDSAPPAPAPPAPLLVPAAPATARFHLNLTVHCPRIDAVLRFPIADLRPGINRDTRRVRPDYLRFSLESAVVSSQQMPRLRLSPNTYILKTTTLDLYYHENDSIPATHIAQASADDVIEGNILNLGSMHTSPLPTIAITFKPRKANKGPFDSLVDEYKGFESTAANPMTTSMYVLKNLRSDLPSPFSGKKIAHHSMTTQHETSPENKVNEDPIIQPGTEEEMSEFTDSCIELSMIHLEFHLPILSLQLESKQLYEIIYNRINSDLLLWEPQIVDEYEINPLACGPINPAFDEFKGTGYDSESETSSSEEENLYYSTYESKLKRGGDPGKEDTEKKDTHNFCLTLNVGKGLLTIYAPARDSNKRVVPGQMGELVLETHRLSLCHVSGLYGRAKTAQLALRAKLMTLYHEPFLTIPSEKPSLRLFGTVLPSHLKTTIYPSGKGVIIKERLQKKDMFCLALKVEPDLETANLKSICIALGIEQATMRHRGDKGIAWLNQFMDVLDVFDFPVPGYTPSTVLSELHVHVSDCAVDYRPLYLPVRALVTLGSFSVASNLIAETNTSSLRFLAQDSSLFLRYVHGAAPHDDDHAPDVGKGYVCVLDVGVFELSFRLEDKEKAAAGTSTQPQVDVSASINGVTLNTCWDSASALFRLLMYIATDGDLQPPVEPSSRHTSICSDQPFETLVGLDEKPVEEIRELSSIEIQQVNDLMAEAMRESPKANLEDYELNTSAEKEGVEVFYFPDEMNSKEKQAAGNDAAYLERKSKLLEAMEIRPDSAEVRHIKPNPHVASELGSVTSTPLSSPRKSTRKESEHNTDEEYCFVDETEALDDDLAAPVVHWHCKEPPPMIDNHFDLPTSRTDVLAPPKDFPVPMLRYTLCEMSIIWNLYGGADFKANDQTTSKKKTVTIKDDGKQGSSTSAQRGKEYESGRSTAAAYRASGVSWSVGAGSVAPRAAPAPRAPRTRGGAHRDHRTRVQLALTKVRFVYDVYTPGGVHGSRQALAIHRIEINDMLQCSNVDKLLTILKQKDEPERNHVYMLVVKAVHRKPDAALPAQECCMKVTMLPVWINLDQDTLIFLTTFFSRLGLDECTRAADDDEKSMSGISTESSGSQKTTPTHRPPVMSVGSHLRDPPPALDASSSSLHDSVIREEPLLETYEAERLVSENLIRLEEDFRRLGLSQDKPTSGLPAEELSNDATSPIYFRRVMFTPDVPIRLDYVGKRVDMSAGPIAGLLLGLGQLGCSEIVLKRLDYKLGILGVAGLVHWAFQEWLTDIKRNQLAGLLGGIGPMHSLLQLLTGIRDLVWLPVEQWRRDGRLVYGLRRGAASFSARTAVAALDITTRLLHLIRATAETAFDMLTPSPTLQLQAAHSERARRRSRRHPARAPADIREGVASAYNTVREGFAETATTMSLAHGESGASLLRHLPGAAVTPLALAAAGAADLLGGVRAHLQPARDERKWTRQPRDPTLD